jgi:Zn-dependent protease
MSVDDPYAPRDAEAEAEAARERRGLLMRLLAPLLVAGGILVKFGVFSVKFFGIFISVGGYALIWGWQFAIGFVLLILVHELGHYVEAKRLGLDPALPVFVPFLGAYVALRNAPFDPWRNARVSLAGPIFGGLGSLAVLLVAESRDDHFLYALAYTGFFLNLVNLVPFGPLDGAHVLRAWQVLRRGGGRADPRAARSLGHVVVAAALVTVALLAAGMWAAHVPQDRL